ncbi:hypothetical protein, partial [Sphingobium yanoikuyae]|uniref:hypothetical protein n=1 Tax=Sphingobium yanoikuyae TaxID=13690 RepID=UPI0026ECF06A
EQIPSLKSRSATPIGSCQEHCRGRANLPKARKIGPKSAQITFASRKLHQQSAIYFYIWHFPRTTIHPNFATHQQSFIVNQISSDKIAP